MSQLTKGSTARKLSTLLSSIRRVSDVAPVESPPAARQTPAAAFTITTALDDANDGNTAAIKEGSLRFFS
jgi:hypothetical protein